MSATSRRSGRILVVDDCPANRAFAAAALLSDGHDVMLADSGPVALAIADAGRLDVILLDLDLGGMDGYATCRAIRTGGSRNRDVVILAYTADCPEAVRAPAAAAGMDGVIEKPCPFARLLETVRERLPERPGCALTEAP